MKLLMLLSFYLLFTSAYAEQQDQKKWHEWIPSGWKLISTATGDLNADGSDDAVLVIEENNLKNQKQNKGLGEMAINENPRRLLVLIKTPTGFQQFSNIEHFIPSAADLNSPCLADPLEGGGVTVQRGLLKVSFQYWSSCGSYGVIHRTFGFRSEGKRFRLVGLDEWEFMRNSGERSEYSINYLTRKKKITTGLNEFEKSKSKSKSRVEWKNISDSGPFYLDQIKPDCAPEEKVNNWCQ